MDSQVLKALASGVFFGAWPLLLNRSGLSGNAAAVTFLVIQLALVLSYGLVMGIGNISTGIDWRMAIAGGVAATFGTLFFKDMLSKASVNEVGLLFVCMIAVQVSVPAIYNIYLTGAMELRTAAGFLFVGVGAVLLLYKTS